MLQQRRRRHCAIRSSRNRVSWRTAAAAAKARTEALAALEITASWQLAKTTRFSR